MVKFSELTSEMLPAERCPVTPCTWWMQGSAYDPNHGTTEPVGDSICLINGERIAVEGCGSEEVHQLIEMTREGPLADVIRAERQAQGNFREIGKE